MDEAGPVVQPRGPQPLPLKRLTEVSEVKFASRIGGQMTRPTRVPSMELLVKVDPLSELATQSEERLKEKLPTHPTFCRH